MPLSLLAILVVVGVSLVVGLAHFLAGMKNELFADSNAVRSRFAVDFPEVKASSIILAVDHKNALLIGEENGDVGLVQSMGAHSLTRKLDARMIKSFAVDGTTLSLQFRDLTLPRVAIKLGTSSLARDTKTKLAETLKLKVEA